MELASACLQACLCADEDKGPMGPVSVETQWMGDCIGDRWAVRSERGE